MNQMFDREMFGVRLDHSSHTPGSGVFLRFQLFYGLPASREVSGAHSVERLPFYLAPVPGQNSVIIANFYDGLGLPGDLVVVSP